MRILLFLATNLAVIVLAWYHGERGAQRVTSIELVMLTGTEIMNFHNSGGSIETFNSVEDLESRRAALEAALAKHDAGASESARELLAIAAAGPLVAVGRGPMNMRANPDVDRRNRHRPDSRMIEVREGLLDGADTARAAADADAKAIPVHLLPFQAGMVVGQPGRRHGQLHEAVHPAGVFLVHVVFGVKALALAPEVDGQHAGVHQVQLGDAAFTIGHMVPDGIQRFTHRADGPHSGDHHPSFMSVLINNQMSPVTLGSINARRLLLPL